MVRLPFAALAAPLLGALTLGGCVTERVYSYPEPLPPPPIPREERVQAPPQEPANVVINVEASQPQQAEVYYYGDHPVPEEWGGDWCDIQGAHSHPYMPAVQREYVSRDNYFYFGADVEFTFDYGHPIPREQGGGWCDHRGPHVHRYHPTPEYSYDRTSRVYSYAPSRPRGRAREVQATPTYPNRTPSYPGDNGSVREIPYGHDTRPTPATATPTYPGSTPSYPSTPARQQPTPTYQQQPSPSYPAQNQAKPTPYGNDVRGTVVDRPAQAQPTYQQPTPAYQQPAAPVRTAPTVDAQRIDPYAAPVRTVPAATVQAASPQPAIVRPSTPVFQPTTVTEAPGSVRPTPSYPVGRDAVDADRPNIHAQPGNGATAIDPSRDPIGNARVPTNRIPKPGAPYGNGPNPSERIDVSRQLPTDKIRDQNIDQNEDDRLKDAKNKKKRLVPSR